MLLTLKALRKKDYSQDPQTLGEHLKKRRRELGLLQREAGERMGVTKETVANWEMDKTKPVTAQFRPVLTFLGYDPTPEPKSLSERVAAKQRCLGASLAQIARYLRWDPGTLARYLDGTWRIPQVRVAKLEGFLSSSAASLAVLDQLGRRRS